MDEQKRPRAWVYARIPGDYDGTMNSYKVCSMQALHDGCDIVGGSIDERGGWLLRPGYRDMMQQIKGGKVDRVYICRMNLQMLHYRRISRIFLLFAEVEISAATLFCRTLPS